MKRANITPKPQARPKLRQAQTELTRQRISEAAAALLEEGSAADSITFKAVAERAGVTEMTVYRHFPTRNDLMQGLWRHLNTRMGKGLGMPESIEALLAQHDALFAGFDRIAPQIIASITTPQGREMRTALNKERRDAFIAIVRQAAPRLTGARLTGAAAVLQLLHSAYAWDAMRLHWGLSGKAAGDATKWAIETLLHEIRRMK